VGERVPEGRVRGQSVDGGDFVIPSVVHWKVGHYAAMVRQEGDRYLLKDPTFGNTVWATRQALEAEASGYFLIPPGELPRDWRTVDAKEGAAVWGKGETSGNGPRLRHHAQKATGAPEEATRATPLAPREVLAQALAGPRPARAVWQAPPLIS